MFRFIESIYVLHSALPPLRRAFDHMIGVMAQTNPAINGCPPTNASPACSNPVNFTDPSSPQIHTDANAVYIQPADPNHSVNDTHQQLFGPVVSPAPNAAPTMNGFVVNCTYVF
jgi:hypothetical protein